LRRLLLVSETALAVLLLVIASLIGRSFSKLIRVDPGYTAGCLLTVRAFAPENGTAQRTGRFMSEMVARLRADGRVIAAGAGNMMPFSDSLTVAAFDIPASIGNGRAVRTRALYYVVTPGYAEALELRLRAGRMLNATDATGSPQRVVINTEFVNQYLSPDRVIGTQLPPRRAGLPPVEIVGVVDPQRQAGNNQPVMPEMYAAAPAAPNIGPEIDLVVKTSGDPAALSDTVRQLARDVDSTFVIGETLPLEHRLSESVQQPRLAAAVLASLGGVTLLLAAGGVYGVLSYSVSQRRRELAVRAALGAERRQLLLMVIGEGVMVAAIGATIGLAASALVTDLMTAMLFGVAPHDPASFIVAPLLLLPVVVVACLWPAAVAARTDPSLVLRQ
jgi:putative ABC transport system permease protein